MVARPKRYAIWGSLIARQPGQIAFTVFFAVAWSGGNLLYDYRNGYLDKLRVAPISRYAILAGEFVPEVVQKVFQRAADAAVRIWRVYAEIGQLRVENRRLREEVERLQGLRGMYGIASPAPLCADPEQAAIGDQVLCQVRHRNDQ